MSAHVNTIVFSKDRPAQLDALLTSIQKYAEWLWPPRVLYYASHENYRAGYCRVEDYHRLGFQWQLPLKEVLISAFDQKRPFSTMLVDDSIFFRPLPILEHLEPRSTYVMALGRNCTYCYPLGRPQNEGELDFLYSISIDGHLYNTPEILEMILETHFNTPNELEDRMYRQQPALRVHYAEHSCLVSIPHNRVAEFNNRFAGGTADELHKRFLAGERIDAAAMDFSKVIGRHQEIPYIWRKV